MKISNLFTWNLDTLRMAVYYANLMFWRTREQITGYFVCIFNIKPRQTRRTRYNTSAPSANSSTSSCSNREHLLASNSLTVNLCFPYKASYTLTLLFEYTYIVVYLFDISLTESRHLWFQNSINHQFLLPVIPDNS